MKKTNNALKPLIIFLVLIALLMMGFSCKAEKESPEIAAAAVNISEEKREKPQVLSEQFKNYWYGGEAEISSYKLEQARYGEIREGTAVLVYVTEDFLNDMQVKADEYSTSNIPVLKLNATKNFNTGIYPYSIMQSTFYPVVNNEHAIKVTASIQEWCGQVYTQLNNRNSFEIISHSYFEGEADQNFKLDKTWTENELWTKLRIDPSSLPTGALDIIPSLEYTRLKHKEIRSYKANATYEDGSYTISYPNLNRTLKINFNPSFPYDILSWEETIPQGYGNSSETITTKATRLESIKSAYWGKNSNADEILREKLKLQ